MDISSTDTPLSSALSQLNHSVKISKMQNDQMETDGRNAVKLIESATTGGARPADPSSPVGQNINTFA